MDLRVDVVANLTMLLNYVSRRLRYYEAIGDLPINALAPEEIVREVYIGAAERLRRRAAPPDFRYRWLRTLADHVIARAVRRLRAERRFFEEAPDASLARRLPEVFPDASARLPEDAAAAAELDRAVAGLIGELSHELREPFLLRVVDGYGRDAVAAIEGVPPEEVDRRAARATLMLRDRLARDYGDRAAPSLDELIRVVEQLRPSAETAAWARAHVAGAAV